MNPGFELALFAMALASAAIGGMLGMASGLFIVPALTVFWNIDIHSAIGASIVSVIACSCASAAPYLEGRLTNVRIAIVLEVATTLGALTGVMFSGLVPVSWLFLIFAIVLALSAGQMLMRRMDTTHVRPSTARKGWAEARLSATYLDRELGREVDYSVRALPTGLGLMYGAGLISALLGVGSGMLKIPAMDTALRLPIKVSSATSNFMIGVTAAASAGAYFVRGDIKPDIAGPIVLGSVIGSILGARVLMRVSSARVRFLFVAVLAILSCQMLASAFGFGTVRRAE